MSRSKSQVGPGQLATHHARELLRSGISSGQARAAGIFSESRPDKLAEMLGREPGFFGSGLVFRYRNERGHQNGYVRVRPDNPRKDSSGRPVRYEAPSNQEPRAFYPPGTSEALADQRKSLLITEGERKSLKASIEGFACIGLSGVWSWQKARPRNANGKPYGKRELISDLAAIEWKGRTVFIAFDNDGEGLKPDVQLAEYELARVLQARGATVKAVRLPSGANGEKCELDDYLVAHSATALRSLMRNATAPQKPRAVRKRETEDKQSSRTAERRGSGRAELYVDHEPWAEAVDGAKLLRDLRAFVRDYLILPEAADLVIVSWVLSAWCVDAFDRFGHLAFTSPQLRCGKTRALEVLRAIAPRAVLAANISGPALFRLVERHKTTVLADEVEKLSNPHSEAAQALRQLLLAGIEKDSVIVRCCGTDFEPKAFHVYGPKALAMIGKPDAILADRCLVVPMQRKGADEKVKPWKRRLVEAEANALAAKCRRWVEDGLEKIEETYDGMEPFALSNNRLADLLSPLQSVIQLADPNCLPELEAYARRLEQIDPDDETLDVQLLAILRDTFGASTFLDTQVLVGRLREEGWRLSPKALGSKLRAYNVHSEHNRTRTRRGYTREALEPVWRRYCPLPAPTPGASVQASIRPVRPQASRRKRRKTRGKT